MYFENNLLVIMLYKAKRNGVTMEIDDNFTV